MIFRKIVRLSHPLPMSLKNCPGATNSHVKLIPDLNADRSYIAGKLATYFTVFLQNSR